MNKGDVDSNSLYYYELWQAAVASETRLLTVLREVAKADEAAVTSSWADFSKIDRDAFAKVHDVLKDYPTSHARLVPVTGGPSQPSGRSGIGRGETVEG